MHCQQGVPTSAFIRAKSIAPHHPWRPARSDAIPAGRRGGEAHAASAQTSTLLRLPHRKRQPPSTRALTIAARLKAQMRTPPRSFPGILYSFKEKVIFSSSFKEKEISFYLLGLLLLLFSSFEQKKISFSLFEEKEISFSSKKEENLRER